MSDSKPEPQLAPAVAFRPVGVPIPDRVFTHAAGFVDETVGDISRRPGAVPPPPPTRPAPTESISARLRARFEQG